MISAFGVDHGERVAKLGPPQYRGRSVTVYTKDKKTGAVTTHAPTDLTVHDTKKKTLILRRPKYKFIAMANMKGADTKKHEYYARPGPLVKPDRATAKKITAHVQGRNKYKSKNIGGLNTALAKG